MEKLVLHAHSCWSHDSEIHLKEWADFIKNNGINKLYLTEHEESGWSKEKYNLYKIDCAKYSTNENMIVPGLELNINGYHFLAPNLKNYDSRPKDEDLIELKEWIHERKSFLIAAHPDKYESFDKKIYSICQGIEIINTKHQYNWFFGGPTKRCESLMREFGLKPFVGQDIHRLNQFSHKGIMIQNTSLLNSKMKNKLKESSISRDTLISLKNSTLKFYSKIKKHVQSFIS